MKKLIIPSLVLFAIACNNPSTNSSTTKDATTNNATGGETTMTPTPNMLTGIEQQEGWQLLFDGKTTAGWHKYGNLPIGTAWKVEDNCLHLDTTQKEGWQIKGGGDIVSENEYADFHLKLEWKIADSGNSGIMFYVHEDTAKFKYPWMTAPEMQVLDNNGHPDSKIFKHRAGDLYDLIPCSKETVGKAGEWNVAEIKSEKGKLDFYLNGTNVVSTNMSDTSWTGMIARSKFKAFPGFGTFKQGRIALQDHGNAVWYRNIKIRKL
jgi:hypothetical protein